MAFLRTSQQDKNALCFLWLTFSLFLLAIVCFGISSTQSSALYAGIVFVILGIFTTIIYIGKKCTRNNTDGDSCCETNCGSCMICCPCCYTDGCCNRCMGKCWRTILCLPPQENHQNVRRLSLSRRDRIRVALANGGIVISNMEDYNDITSANRNNRTVSLSKLRAAEQEIQTLYQEYSFLQTDANTATQIAQDYSQLEFQNAQLTLWIEGNTNPSEEEFKAMKQALKKVKRSFRIARTRLTQDTSVRPDMTTDINQAATVHQLMMYASDMAVPPPYQAQDPLDQASISTNSTIVQNCSISSLSNQPNSGIIDPVQHNTNGNAPSYTRHVSQIDNSGFRNDNQYDSSNRTDNSIDNTNISHHLPYNVNGYADNRRSSLLHTSTTNLLDNAYYLNTSICSLPPPADETGAPPSYEDATSTTV